MMREPSRITPSKEAAWRRELDRLLKRTPMRTDEPEPLHCPGDVEHVSGPLLRYVEALKARTVMKSDEGTR